MTRAVDAATIDAGRLLLERLGLTAHDLLSATADTRKPRPTFGTYIPQVVAAMKAGNTRTQYKGVWNKLLKQPGWADRPIDEPTVTELEALVEQFRAGRRIRRNARGGRSTAVV
jgi:hypothetical protein